MEPNARCKAIREGAKELLMCRKLEGDDEGGEEVKRFLEKGDEFFHRQQQKVVSWFGGVVERGYLSLSLSCEARLAEVLSCPPQTDL